MFQPMVYEVKEVEGRKGEYFLDRKLDLFALPDKIYFGYDKKAIRFWTTFAMRRGSMGVLFTGLSGSGKTELSKILSNIAINNKMPVIIVSEIEATIELVHFIDNLDRAVILFDEFGKCFNINLQDKMLTMFSNLNNSKKLYIITENDKRDISRYIRNRPGRVLYHIDFNRLTEAELEEYCADFNIKPEFYKELKAVHKKSTVFIIDHLKALIDEHIAYPDDSFEYILNILNLDVLTKSETVTVESIYDIGTKEPLEINNASSINRKDFDSGRYLWAHPQSRPAVKINRESVVEITDTSMECLVDGKFKVILIIG